MFSNSSLDYFSFIKRLMELLRMYNRIRKIELEIQTIDESKIDVDHPSRSLHYISYLNLSVIQFQPNNM
jgi:hypothetical protein